MKEKDARQQGYRYTGISDLGSGRDTFEVRVEELKKQGFKVVKVHEKSSPYSRGGAISWNSAYIKYKKLSESELATTKLELSKQQIEYQSTQDKMKEVADAILKLQNEQLELQRKLRELGSSIQQNEYKIEDSQSENS